MVHNLATTSLTTLREAPDGRRTLCLTPLRSEERLGDPVIVDLLMEEDMAPLIARFAALVFTEHDDMVEPLLQQLRWVAYEHNIDHVVLPLWPESRLAQRLGMVAIDLGLPHDFLLTQDEDSWPVSTMLYQQRRETAAYA